MSKTDAEMDDQKNATDVADRLCRMMRKIQQAANQLRFEDPSQPSNPIRRIRALHKPLYEVFEPIALELDFESYAELRDNFIGLCNRVIRDIGTLNLKREETRERWIQAAKQAKDVFEAKNFGSQTETVLQNHFSIDVYQRLEDASERLQITERHEASVEQLAEALDAARGTLSAYEKNGNIPSEIGRILKLYIQQIENAYQHYEDFGEELFWKTYKELFATFLQVHNVIMPKETNEEVKSALNVMGNKMKYGLQALSVSSDLATIAATGMAIFQLA